MYSVLTILVTSSIMSSFKVFFGYLIFFRLVRYCKRQKYKTDFIAINSTTPSNSASINSVESEVYINYLGVPSFSISA